MIAFVQNNIFSIVTAIIAIIAIWQTHIQIRISNKQYLFEKRVEKYTLAYSLLKLYKENQSLLDYSASKDNEAIIVDFQFENLTNSTYLKNVTAVIYDLKNKEEKTKFLVKLEEIEKSANEIKFLFKGYYAEILRDFVNNYKNVLLELYKYQIVQNLMSDKDITINNNKTYEELKKIYGEQIHRKRLYHSIEELNNSYKKIENQKVIETLEDEIRL